MSSAIIEWKQQQRCEHPFVFAVCFRIRASDASKPLRAATRAPIVGRLDFWNGTSDTNCSGNIVVIRRGGTSFSSKYESAVSLGAAAVVIANTSESKADELFSPAITVAVKGSALPPPCLMISLASYRRLCLDTPFTVTISPFQSSFIARVPSGNLAAAIRSCAAFGEDTLLKDYLNEVAIREKSEENGVNVKSILAEREAGRGATALQVAVECRQPSCLSLLLRSGADTEFAKEDGYCALHIAACNNDLECLALLVDCGSYLDRPHEHTGWTALHFACHHSSLDCLRILLEAGSCVNARAFDGCTPLHVACLVGNVEVLTVLLNAGADCLAVNNAGAKASQISLLLGSTQLVAMIEKQEKIEDSKRTRRRSQILETAPSVGSSEADDWRFHEVYEANARVEGTNSSYDNQSSGPLKTVDETHISSDELLRRWSDSFASLSNGVISELHGMERDPASCQSEESLVDLDLKRICFVEFREEPKQQQLRLLAQVILRRKDLFYRQGMLSMIAPMTMLLDRLDLDDEGSFSDLSNLFIKFIDCFPILRKLYRQGGEVECFQPMFDQVVILLKFWMPDLAATLLWRRFVPALFAVPWVSTMLAEVLASVQDTMWLWTHLLELFAEKATSSDDCRDEIADRITASVITAVLVQLSEQILGLNLMKSSKSSWKSTNSHGETQCRPGWALPDEEDLMLLFSWINNNNVVSRESSEESDFKFDHKSFGILSVKDLLRCTKWIFDNSPSHLFAETPLLLSNAELWSSLGSLTKITMDQLTSLSELSSVLIIDMTPISHTKELSVAASELEKSLSQILALRNGLSSSSSSTSSSGAEGAPAEPSSPRMKGLPTPRRPTRTNSFLQGKADVPPASCCTLLHFEQLKISGMVAYYRELSAAINSPHQLHHRRPPTTIATAPKALKLFQSQGFSWVTAMRGESSSISTPKPPVVVLVSSPRDLSVDTKKESAENVAALMICCGFSRLLLYEYES